MSHDFSQGRLHAGLAQRTSCVALAWHIARGNTPIRVTSSLHHLCGLAWFGFTLLGLVWFGLVLLVMPCFWFALQGCVPFVGLVWPGLADLGCWALLGPGPLCWACLVLLGLVWPRPCPGLAWLSLDCYVFGFCLGWFWLCLHVLPCLVLRWVGVAWLCFGLADLGCWALLVCWACLVLLGLVWPPILALSLLGLALLAIWLVLPWLALLCLHELPCLVLRWVGVTWLGFGLADLGC